MSKARGRAKVRLTVKLDIEWDADVIAWLMKVPRGQRSTAVRDAIRGMLSPQQAANLEAIRSVVAQELASALTRQPLREAAEPSSIEDNSAEARYGAKLNKMMSGLSKPNDSP
jgi:hypothetical protein